MFHNTNINKYFKINSTIKTNHKIKLNNITYPYITINISSKSHPFYTKKLKTITSKKNVTQFTQHFNHFVNTKKKNIIKILNSLHTTKKHHPNYQIIKQKKQLYIIYKSNPHFKTIQNHKKKH